MGGVFINYRNQDEPFAAALVDRELSARLGTDMVFRASRSVVPGDFRPQILEKLKTCDVLVAVIGKTWLTAVDSAGHRRLDDPDDWVRQEIEIALAGGIRVIPLLVNADMPPASALPPTLADLVVQDYTRLHHRTDDTDLQRLARMVEQVAPELAFFDLVEPVAAPLVSAQPSAMLDPHAEMVRFRDRGDLDQVLGWCADADGTARVLLTGSGGAGKTRLAVELCHRLRAAGWTTGFVPRRLTAAAFDRLDSAHGPALLVLDDAESRIDQVRSVLATMSRRPSGTRPVVTVVIARSVGDWIDELEDLGGTLLHHHVAVVPGDNDEVSWAVRSFAERLGVVVPGLDAVFPTAVDAHEAALAHALGAPAGLAGLLRRERQLWRESRELFELPDPHLRRLDDVVAAACLYGARDNVEALHVLGLVPSLGNEPGQVLQRYVDWVRALYPGEDVLNAMGSAAMTDRHVSTVLARSTALLDLLPAVSDEQAVQAVSLLGRAAPRHLKAAFERDTSRLPARVVAALPDISARQSPGPLVDALTALLPELPLDALDRTLAGLPQRSLTLARFAAQAEKEGWRRFRAAGQPKAAGRFALRFAGRAAYMAGAEDEVRRAVADALTLLDKGDPADLAEAWAVAALVERDGEAAIAAGAQAIDRYRRCGPTHDGAFAYALHNQANRLRRSGYANQAVELAVEAVDRGRAAVRVSRSSYLALLVDTLDHLGRLRGQNGGLVHAGEAVDLARELAARRPDAHIVTLARCLNTVGKLHLDAGDREDARIALVEARTWLSRIAPEHRDQVAGELGVVEHNLALLDEESG